MRALKDTQVERISHSTNIRSIRMEEIRLSALIIKGGEGFQANIEDLNLVSNGITITEAQDKLIEKFAAWVQACEGKDRLGETLSSIGLSSIDEDTELVLEFQEQILNE
jgi:hypothetical protein